MTAQLPDTQAAKWESNERTMAKIRGDSVCESEQEVGPQVLRPGLVTAHKPLNVALTYSQSTHTFCTALSLNSSQQMKSWGVLRKNPPALLGLQALQGHLTEFSRRTPAPV